MSLRRILYIAIVVVCICFYVMYKDYLSFLTLVFVLALPVCLFILLVLVKRGVRVDLASAFTSVNKGEEVAIELRFDNRWILPISRVEADLTCFNHFSGQQEKKTFVLAVSARNLTVVRAAFFSEYCGNLFVRLDKVRFYDYGGLFCLGTKPRKELQIAVMPKIYPLEADLKPDMGSETDSDLYSSRKSGDDVSEVFDIRSYHAGDKLRSIHWKLSSKRDDLMVKEFSLPLSTKIVIVLDMAVDSVKDVSDFSQVNQRVEVLLETAISISYALISQKIQHVFEWYHWEEQFFHQVDIQSPEDLFETMRSILRMRAYQTDACLQCHHALQHQKTAAHTYYITACLNDEMFGHLPSKRRSQATSVLYVSKEQMSAQTEGYLTRLEEEHYQVVRMCASNFEEVLSTVDLGGGVHG